MSLEFDELEEEKKEEVAEAVDAETVEKSVGATDKADDKKESDKEDDYEDVCFMCRRPEHITGKMFKLPNHICVCNDCMHKTMDTVSQYDYQGTLNHPGMMMTPEEFNSFQNQFPNITFMNLADLQGQGGISNKQKFIKKYQKNLKWN